MRTIADLNEKVWYRFLKVIYCLAYILTAILVITVLVSSSCNDLKFLFFFILVVVAVVEGARRALYYTVLGKLAPEND